MKVRILVSASLLAACAGVLPAADPTLLKLVMPDVKVISDVNVAQAKITPFGQYVLSQLSSSEVQQLKTLTGFDPAQDLNELLCASNGTQNTGLALATGVFDPTLIGKAAAQDGAVSATYNGVTILEDPTKTHGVAFLNNSLMAAGDIADVEAAIDRQKNPTTLPKTVTDQITQLSNQEDAWVYSLVPPSSFPHAPSNPQGNLGGVTIPPNALSQVQSGWAGVKFGSNIMVTAQAQTADATTATNLASMLQLLQNLALMQGAQNQNLENLAQSVSITASGTAVNITATLPEDQFQALVKPRRAVRKSIR